MKFIHRAALVLIVLCLSAGALAQSALSVADPASIGFSTERLTQIGAWYQKQIDAGALPGAVVAIARDGKLAYVNAIGYQDRARTVPMRPDAIFWIASMTKPVTSVAAMMLVEEGKLDLDAPVSRYLPDLKDMQVATEETDPLTGTARTVLAPQKHAMTVRDLLRHTSGLIYPPQFISTNIHRVYGEKVVFTRNTTLADFVASLGKVPLAHQPGEVWEYSWGVDVLARVVEVASGQPLDQFLQGRIFGPLHMIDTGFYVPESKLSRLVDPPPGGRDALWDVTKPPRLFSGGGGLVSTAADYLRFCQMLLSGGELDGVRILTPETLQLMTTNSLPADIRFAMDWIGPRAGASWGLGFEVRTNPGFSSVPGAVGSFTWSGLWGTYFWIDPGEKLIAVQMIQVPPDDTSQFSTRAALRFLTYAALSSPEEDGRLLIEPSGPFPVLDFDVGKPIAVHAISDREFYYDGGDHTRIAFITDQSGKVTGAILNPGSREIKGESRSNSRVRPLLADIVAKRSLVLERRTVFSHLGRIGNFDSQNRPFGFYYCRISLTRPLLGDFCNNIGRGPPTLAVQPSRQLSGVDRS